MELGTYNYVGKEHVFETEKRSILFVGKSKSETKDALVRLALNDICNNSPVVFFGSDGTAVDEILSKVPRNSQHKVLYINPNIQPFALNILNRVENSSLFTVTLMEALKGIWNYDRTATPVLDQYLRAGLLTLLNAGNNSLLSLKPLLTNEDYRVKVVGDLKDEVLKDFWRDFEDITDKDKRNDTSSTLNKLSAFSLDTIVRSCIAQKTHHLDFKDNVVLVSLNENLIGKENARLLGAIILTQLFLEGVDGLGTTLYIEGASRYGNAILGNVLSYCPNIKTMASVQFLDQFDNSFIPTLLGTVEGIVAFRTSVKDAKTLDSEFRIPPLQTQLFELSEQSAKVMLDGTVTGLSMYPNEYPRTGQEEKIIKRCLEQCTEDKKNTNKRIRDLYGNYVKG